MSEHKTTDLRPWGWASGGYAIRCMDCSPPEPPFGTLPMGDKRAWRCETCALKAREADVASSPRATEQERALHASYRQGWQDAVGWLRSHADAHAGKWGSMEPREAVKSAAAEMEVAGNAG